MKATNQLDKPELSARERAEAKAELVLAGRVQWWRELMKKGKVVKAAEYAKRYGFEEVVAEDLIAMEKFKEVIAMNPEPVAVPEVMATFNPIFLASGQVATPVLVDDRGELKDGWPVRAEAEVSRYPVNPRMVVVTFADGRTAVLWNHKGGRWTLGSKVKVKLDNVVGGEDAYYVGDYEDAPGTSGV